MKSLFYWQTLCFWYSHSNDEIFVLLKNPMLLIFTFKWWNLCLTEKPYAFDIYIQMMKSLFYWKTLCCLYLHSSDEIFVLLTNPMLLIFTFKWWNPCFTDIPYAVDINIQMMKSLFYYQTLCCWYSHANDEILVLLTNPMLLIFTEELILSRTTQGLVQLYCVICLSSMKKQPVAWEDWYVKARIHMDSWPFGKNPI